MKMPLSAGALPALELLRCSLRNGEPRQGAF